MQKLLLLECIRFERRVVFTLSSSCRCGRCSRFRHRPEWHEWTSWPQIGKFAPSSKSHQRKGLVFWRTAFLWCKIPEHYMSVCLELLRRLGWSGLEELCFRILAMDFILVVSSVFFFPDETANCMKKNWEFHRFWCCFLFGDITLASWGYKGYHLQITVQQPKGMRLGPCDEPETTEMSYLSSITMRGGVHV